MTVLQDFTCLDALFTQRLQLRIEPLASVGFCLRVIPKLPKPRGEIVGRILRLGLLCVSMPGLGAILLTTGCGSGGNTRFRLMNAVPDESSLNVLVDSTSVSSQLAYGTSAGFLSESSGSHQVAIEPAGSSTTLLQQSISFTSGSDTTV